MLSRFNCLFTAIAIALSVASLRAVEVPSAPQIEKTADATDATIFRIEDAKSRVSLASVRLSVGDLKVKEGKLVGEYTIHVPLMSSSDDHGMIVLPLNISIDELGSKGGTLRGQAISFKEGTTPNVIVCEVIPNHDQQVLLDITTETRTIKFKSNYTVVKTLKDS